MVFENFFADMGRRPDKTTLGRINNNGNYEPENCEWQTVVEQNRNKTTNITLTFQGQSMLAIDWARHLNVSYQTIYARFRKGWSDEECLMGKK